MQTNNFASSQLGDDIASYMRSEIARIIYFRLGGQVAGQHVDEKAWETALVGWSENPAAFAIVEVCLDSADEILKYFRQNTHSDNLHSSARS
ncbi:hypothetical protein [Aquamicrobium ahrensii]|uniref:Ubiquinone biosynthesis protein COQ9 n=1 Tax=Aquamicrobium ahrensii TaxID=469551 RepID=A0ABV2KN67_9HYPH